MLHFLRLSQKVINIQKIIQVDIYSNFFRICMINDHFTSGGFIAGTGFMFGNNQNYYDVKKEVEPKDYQIVQKWIDEIEKHPIYK